MHDRRQLHIFVQKHDARANWGHMLDLEKAFKHIARIARHRWRNITIIHYSKIIVVKCQAELSCLNVFEFVILGRYLVHISFYQIITFLVKFPKSDNFLVTP